ncbi:hypothetical protein BCD72_004305 [Clostridium butyricum]|jgi:hypothetical protein|nr:MAG: hypothetical protein Q607_CBUC00203G0007 [Clostridium butyricum DORA_1]MBA8968736.1 hypothetical protein [Clostridium butyricum]MBA8973409.1 hypothetical protein [Clostridium butyricum]NOW39646.1 hypothetical protein [Clostridium butyricum]
MNYDYIENLVKKSKDGDEYSKEKIIYPNHNNTY